MTQWLSGVSVGILLTVHLVHFPSFHTYLRDVGWDRVT